MEDSPSVEECTCITELIDFTENKGNKQDGDYQSQALYLELTKPINLIQVKKSSSFGDLRFETSEIDIRISKRFEGL